MTSPTHFSVEIKCQLDVTDYFYCRSYCLLNMFRAPICPSSGAREYYTSACCLWYLVLWFSSCRYGVDLTVMCPVCGLLQQQTSLNSVPVSTVNRTPAHRLICRHNIDCVYTDEHEKKKSVVLAKHRTAPWRWFLRETETCRSKYYNFYIVLTFL